MADKPFDLRLDVRGELDTSAPIADRPPGTLVAAPDVRHDAWGPRRGSQAFTQAMEGPGTASLYGLITLGSAQTARAQGRAYDRQFADLGTKFTLDLWFRLTDLAYATTNDISIYGFSAGGVGLLSVGIRGPTHANAGKIYVSITTSVDRSTPASAVALTGSTVVTTGSTQAVKHHVRVVRDGATVTLYLDGVQDGQTTGLSATNLLIGADASGADVSLGADAFTALGSTEFYGVIYGAWLRDGAFTSQPIEARMPCSPHARNVHHAHLGMNHDLGGNDHYFDAGRFSAHAIIVTADYTVTAANENAAPAPTPVQGLRPWTTRTNRTALSVMVGGQLCTAGVT